MLYDPAAAEYRAYYVSQPAVAANQILGRMLTVATSADGLTNWSRPLLPYVPYENYSFQCGSTLHHVYIGLSVVWLLLFCVAFPVVVLLGIVLPVQTRPQWMRDYLVLDFLTQDFRPVVKWWEVVFNARRLTFAVIVTVVSGARVFVVFAVSRLDDHLAVKPQLKVLIFAVFALSFLMLHMGVHPYKERVNNLLETASLASVLITFIIQGYVLAYGDPNDGALIFVVVLNCIVGAVLVVMVVRDAIPLVVQRWNECRNWRANKTKRAALRKAAMDVEMVAPEEPLEEKKPHQEVLVM